jgi:hypothetical protein
MPPTRRNTGIKEKINMAVKPTKKDEDLDLIVVKFDQLMENVDNPNEMNDKDFRNLVDSIKTYGYIEPAVVVALPMEEPDDDEEDADDDEEGSEDKVDRTQKYYILDGHHRIKAYKQIHGNKTDEIPVNLAIKVTEAQAYIAAITFNKTRGKLDTMKVAKLIQKGVTTYGEAMVAKHTLLGRDALQEYTTIMNNKFANIVDDVHKDGSTVANVAAAAKAKDKKMKQLASSSFDNLTQLIMFPLKKQDHDHVMKVLRLVHPKDNGKALLTIVTDYIKNNPKHDPSKQKPAKDKKSKD